MKFKQFERHLIIPEFGIEKQNLISKSSVLVIGAGGLGSAAIIYLAASGVGHIGIVDYDIVEITNLNRQILYNHDDINKSKIAVAVERISKINPETKVTEYNLKLDKSNISKIIEKYDFIIEATDNINTKLLINDTCVKFKKPFSYAGINKFAGSTLTIIPEKSACLRCIFKNIKQPNSSQGVFGPVPGIVGIIQASEALKFLGKFGQLLVNRFLYINLFTMEFRVANITKDKNCYLCGNS